jgi:hypothetical protein
MDLPALQNASLTQVTTAIAAIGALGTAAFGLVDASKLLPWLVPSAGFGKIKTMIHDFAPPDAAVARESGLSVAAMTASLRSNWLNGMALADQKAVAKTLIKLRLDEHTAPRLAALTGVPASVAIATETTPIPDADPGLVAVARALANGQSLTPQQLNVYGRFDILLSTAIDRPYQRADQLYRTTAKVAACVTAILLAEGAAAAMHLIGPHNWNLHVMLSAFMVGLIATPLAPIAKDLTTALTSAASAVQSVRK